MAAVSASLRRARPLLGTFVEMAALGAAPPVLEAAIDEAFATVAEVHRLMSFFDEASDIGRLNRHAGGEPVAIHAWTYRVLQTADDIYRRSDGVFDISVGGTIARTRLQGPDPSPIELLDGRWARLSCPATKIDLGGIAKGFAVDQAVDMLRTHGLVCGTVNAGGDLAVFGPQPQPVDIRDPRSPRQSLCRVQIREEALASSAGRYDPFASARSEGCAVIDPRVRRTVPRIIGASVRAPSCMIADALTKAAMILGEDALALLQHFGAEALLVTMSGCSATPGWQGAQSFAA